jgi:hypothetical protein
MFKDLGHIPLLRYLLILVLWLLMVDGKLVATFQTKEECEAAKTKMIYQMKLGIQVECVPGPEKPD